MQSEYAVTDVDETDRWLLAIDTEIDKLPKSLQKILRNAQIQQLQRVLFHTRLRKEFEKFRKFFYPTTGEFMSSNVMKTHTKSGSSVIRVNKAGSFASSNRPNQGH